MLLIGIVLVSSVLSIASGIGIDGWTALSGSDPSLTAVDISAKGNDVYILGNDGAIHYWSVSALTPDGDWQWIDESNGQRQTTYPIKQIAATSDGCVWTLDQNKNISVYNSNAANWTSHQVAPGYDVIWVSGYNCSVFEVTFNMAGWVCTVGENGLWEVYPSNAIYQCFHTSKTTSTLTQYPGTAKQIDAENSTLIIIVDQNNNMLLWNAGSWKQIPGTAGARATINKSQAFYIDASGNAYSANITP